MVNHSLRTSDPQMVARISIGEKDFESGAGVTGTLEGVVRRTQESEIARTANQTEITKIGYCYR